MQTASLQTTGRTCGGGQTCEPGHSQTLSGSTLSAGAFPVRIFPTPGRGQDLTASGQDCSSKPFAWFANSDRASLCWKTWQRCLLGDWTEFSGRWPRSGLMRNGIAYRLPPLVPLTAGKESGSLPFGTPTASEKIATAYPTPNMGERFRRRHGGNLLESVAHHMWPTPSASQMPCEGTVRLCRKAWLDGNATLEEASAIAGRDVRKHQGKVPAMLPTPTVQDASNNADTSQYQRNSLPLNAVAGGALNPT